MRQLFDSLETLASDQPVEGKAVAQAFLSECQARAEGSCRKLRKQVA